MCWRGGRWLGSEDTDIRTAAGTQARRHACDETSAAERGEHSRDVGQILEDLESDGRVARDEIIIIEWVDERPFNARKCALLHRTPALVERRLHKSRAEGLHARNLCVR